MDYSHHQLANKDQKGDAAEMRTFVSNWSDRKELHDIEHSGDKDPHKQGPNSYADNTNSYDQRA